MCSTCHSEEGYDATLGVDDDALGDSGSDGDGADEPTLAQMTMGWRQGVDEDAEESDLSDGQRPHTATDDAAAAAGAAPIKQKRKFTRRGRPPKNNNTSETTTGMEASPSTDKYAGAAGADDSADDAVEAARAAVAVFDASPVARGDDYRGKARYRFSNFGHMPIFYCFYW